MLCFRYLSDRFWPATILLYMPRWLWLIPLLVLLPLSIRRRKVWIIPVLTGVFILGPLMGFNVPWRRIVQRQPDGQKLRLLTCNIHRLELDISALDGFIIASDPDVVVLQDYSGWDDSPVLRSGWNVFRLGEIFIASRFPIRDARNLDLEAIPGDEDDEIPRNTGSAACFDLQTPGGIVHLLDIHLASPHSGFRALPTRPARGIWKLRTNTVRRWNECAKISDYLSTLRGPVILAGDFNTLSESPIYRHFWSGYGEAFTMTGWGYGYTHYSPLTALQLDHILCGPEVTCTSCQLGPPCGTPHRPMVAELVLTSQNPGK
jgi:endonuclease/exonuclease/phosphatase (EEP) superfamily protein YafD